MTTTRPKSDLERLAETHGVLLRYYDNKGVLREADEDALIQVLRALDVPLERADDAAALLVQQERRALERRIAPVTVIWGEDCEVAVTLSLSREEDAARADQSLQWTMHDEQDRDAAGSVSLGEIPQLEAEPLSDGTTVVARRLVVAPRLPYGYHRLRVKLGERTSQALIIVAPETAYRLPEGTRDWGVFAPTYALHQARSWGVGDWTDLAALVQWVARHGGSVVATLPMLAAYLGPHWVDPSPYAPVSMRFWNELYVDVDAVPELAQCAEAKALRESSEVRGAIQALQAEPHVKYDEAMHAKRRVLEVLAQWWFDGGVEHAAPERKQSWQRFLKEPEAQRYARFRAAHDRTPTQWTAWPQAQRDGEIPAEAYDEASYRYHLYAQWLAREQLEQTNRLAKQLGVQLYADMPIGVHPFGYDTYTEREQFALGMSVGAPPDAFFSKGQNWGFPPLKPEAMRESGHRYFIESVRQLMRTSGILRIDHVMGLYRRFWIPEGRSAEEGVYVLYPVDELFAVVCLESHREQTAVVGEDLGTVPPIVREEMDAHHLHRMYVQLFEMQPEPQAPLKEISDNVIASVNTHDTPTFLGALKGKDLDNFVELGVLSREDAAGQLAERERNFEMLAEYLREHTDEPVSEPAKAEELLLGSLRLLAESDAPVVLATLEDLWLEEEPQNVPATTDEMRPNWRRKTKAALDHLDEASAWPLVSPALELLASLRPLTQEVAAKRKTPALPAEPAPAAAPPPPKKRIPWEQVTERRMRHDVTRLTEDDLHYFNEGTHRSLYRVLGAHIMHAADGTPGTYFAVWAPNAAHVSLVGDVNDWTGEAHPLKPHGNCGIWEGFVEGLAPGSLYKYRIKSRFHGFQVDKADPYGFKHEGPPNTASIVWDLAYEWHDGEWMRQRHQFNALNAPINIYEVHLGSWMRDPDTGASLTYSEIAPRLAEYVRRLGFTHVELMPVMEHPFNGSWGYQSTGYFAPTSRWGSPQQFKAFVDTLHQAGIGVILDWVPSHFPGDEHGLVYFDGTHLYEHADPRKGFHPDWESYIFNYDRNEVRAFLESSAHFWLEEYHVDGLRVDAVASMLYLDYSREPGEWIPNEHGGRENLGAIHFLRRLNEGIYQKHPDVQTFAEESTSWPMVSRPTYVGGLGFGLKWDMGWMHDTLKYMHFDPVHRSYHHNRLSFRGLYAFNENFTLPLSHDEVVHGKGSLINKMPGDPWQRFANLRLLYAYMYAQPGKKLLFMGGEIGQWREWNHDHGIDWHLLQHPPHGRLLKYVADLNHLYRTLRALWEVDFHWEGFEWIDANDALHSTLSFLRYSKERNEILLCAFNFTPVPRHNHRLGVPQAGRWQEILNSDAELYGGSNHGNYGGTHTEDQPWHNKPHSLTLTLPPLGAVYMRVST